MLKLLEYEAVEYRHWVGNEEFVNMLSSSFLFPGLTAIKLTALIGYKAGGLIGLILAVLSLNLPGLVLALGGYYWLTTHQTAAARKLMTAVQYGAIVLLASATYSLAQSVLNIHFSLPLILASLLFFLAVTFWDLSPAYCFISFIVLCFFLE